MANRSGDLGRLAENAVITVLHSHGFPGAERRRLRGIHDAGDITGTPGLVWEVKGGHAAENASDGQIREWLWETENERVNGEADIGILVVKRKGIGYANADFWWAIMDGHHINSLLTGDDVGFAWWLACPVRLHLGDACHWLSQDYGTAVGGAA